MINDLLRGSLALIHHKSSVGDGSELHHTLAINTCRIEFIDTDAEILEVWFWCPSIHAFLSLVESILEIGLTPIALGTLDGRLIPIKRINFELEQLNQLLRTKTWLCGEIAFEFFSDPRSWIRTVAQDHRVKTVKINLSKRQGVVVTTRPMNVKTFFDNLSRIIRPRVIPPKIVKVT